MTSAYVYTTAWKIIKIKKHSAAVHRCTANCFIYVLIQKYIDLKYRARCNGVACEEDRTLIHRRSCRAATRRDSTSDSVEESSEISSSSAFVSVSTNGCIGLSFTSLSKTLSIFQSMSETGAEPGRSPQPRQQPGRIRGCILGTPRRWGRRRTRTLEKRQAWGTIIRRWQRGGAAKIRWRRWVAMTWYCQHNRNVAHSQQQYATPGFGAANNSGLFFHLGSGKA